MDCPFKLVNLTTFKRPLRWNILQLWSIIEQLLFILYVPELIKEKQLDKSFTILFNDWQKFNIRYIKLWVYTIYNVDISESQKVDQAVVP